MTRMHVKLLALTATLGLSVPALAQPAEKPVSIVLVHSAFVDASGWRAVYDLLSRDSYDALVIQNPTITLNDDAPSPAARSQGAASAFERSLF